MCKFCSGFSSDGEHADLLEAVLFINRQGIRDLKGYINCFLPCIDGGTGF